MEYENLQENLLAAHDANDKPALVKLYHQAGEMMLAADDIDAACFYLTHAYIFALDCGDSSAPELHKMLVGFGREQ